MVTFAEITENKSVKRGGPIIINSENLIIILRDNSGIIHY